MAAAQGSKAGERQDRGGVMALRLYVAAGAPNSERALANLDAIREKYLDVCNIEVIDVFEAPERALADDVLVTPTLLRVSPLPVRRIIGDLSQVERVVRALLYGSEKN